MLAIDTFSGTESLPADTRGENAARRPGQFRDGFTLLEVLVAMTILAIGITLGVALISGSLGNIRKVEARTRLMEHASVVMEQTLLDQSIQGAGMFNGDFADGARWTVRVEEYVPPAIEQTTTQEMPVKLLAYTVEISYPRSRGVDYRLRTLKIVSPQVSPMTAVGAAASPAQ